jgi:hypothetical protein
MDKVPHHTHPVSDIRGLEPRLERLEKTMRNPGHNHPAVECDESAHGPVDTYDDAHPQKHEDHPYIAASHRFTKPAFHATSKETGKGQDVSTKGDKSFGSY